jgi:hypothetical protein
VRRYEREHPGELIHADIKKSSPGSIVLDIASPVIAGATATTGWEYVRICIDDASRNAYAEIKRSERKASAVAFLKAR